MWAAVIDEGRRLAESLMVDSITFLTPSGGTRYAGRCKLQLQAAQAQDSNGDSSLVTYRSMEVHLPVAATLVIEGDVGTVTASPNDPTNVGRRLRALSRFGKTWATAQRVPVDEVSSRFTATVVVASYLGSSGFGASWAAPVTWPANIVAVSQLDGTGAGDEFGSQVKVRVPASQAGVQASTVFTVGSTVTVAGVVSTVVSVQPFTRDGVTEYVEVTAR